jgi:acetyl-CoA synthetase
MDSATRLDAYHFYEEEWESYEQLRDAFEWEVPDTFNIAQYICDRWANDKNRVALYWEDAAGNERTYTFWQTRQIANRFANELTDAGVGRGDRVGVNLPQKPETLFAHLAIWKLGAVSVPLSTLFGPDALSFRLDNAGATACVIDEENVDTLREVTSDVPSLTQAYTVGDVDARDGETDFWSAIDGQSTDFEAVTTGPDDDALLIYTSGTTGNPKGVMHGHRVLLGHLPMFVSTFFNMEDPAEPENILWSPGEWAWILMVWTLLSPLYYGTAVMAYDDGQFDPEAQFRLIEKYGLTHGFIPPTAMRMMQNSVEDPAEQYDLKSVKVLAGGGEALTPSLVDWAESTFGDVTIHQTYGQTEADVCIGACTALTEFKYEAIGPAAPGHDVRIVDPDTAEPTVTRGEVGEIAVRFEGNPVCMKEYWKRSRKTDEKIRNGWLLTEDLGMQDEDRFFTFKSRKDDVIISAGYRIGPEEIEECLATHEALADAGVIGVPDDEGGEVPKAFIVTADGYDASEGLCERLRDHVKDQLAKYEYPREIEVIDELPKTVTGKVRREDLRE